MIIVVVLFVTEIVQWEGRTEGTLHYNTFTTSYIIKNRVAHMQMAAELGALLE